jgi:hypothetical protein
VETLKATIVTVAGLTVSHVICVIGLSVGLELE